MEERFLEIAAEGSYIRLTPQHRLYPTAVDDHDRDWIATLVQVQGSVFSGEFMADCMVSDFVAFKQEMKKLETDLNAAADFKTMEGPVSIKIKGDGLGHLLITIQLTPVPGNMDTLVFSMESDQTQIKPILRQLEAITCAYT